MNEFIDGIELFASVLVELRDRAIGRSLPLEDIVLKACRDKLAYIDNRQHAKKYGFDFWESIRKEFKNEDEFRKWLTERNLNHRILYSKSDQFPDFMFKIGKSEGNLYGGSLLELKDSGSGSIASFNSTIPTKYKSLNELTIIDGNDLVLKIASIMDKNSALEKDYTSFQRKCFYLIRTNRSKDEKIKISIVDGSFFETIPKEQLIHQMILNMLSKESNIPESLFKEIEKYLPSDQTTIVASQKIEKASVRPRLRIMTEVHPEGNPHGSSYPEIKERTFNLILQDSGYAKQIQKNLEELTQCINLDVFTIQHKRNGKHIVFQYRF